MRNEEEKWAMVKEHLYSLWTGFQAGPIIPEWMDFEFNRQYIKFKKEHKLKDVLRLLHFLSPIESDPVL